MTFNSRAKAKSSMSVSDNLNESPILLEESLILFKNSFDGALTFNSSIFKCGFKPHLNHRISFYFFFNFWDSYLFFA